MFSTRLKEARKKTGMTQYQAADALGLERTRYGKWETGKSVPSLEMIPTICKAFGVSADFLLNDDAGTEDLDVAGQGLASSERSFLTQLMPIITGSSKQNDYAITRSFEKSVKKQKELGADFDMFKSIRKVVVDLLGYFGQQYPTDVAEAYIRFEIGLKGLLNASSPETINAIDAYRQKYAAVFGQTSDEPSEKKTMHGIDADMQAIIAKMVRQQVAEQLKEAMPEVAKTKKTQ